MNHSRDESSDSDDDFEPTPSPPPPPPVDPKQLKWGPWMWFYAKKGYEYCDAAGEKLAWFFGITKPKYHAELQEYERMDEEERQAWQQAFQDVEHRDEILQSIITAPPTPMEIFSVTSSNDSTRQ